MELRLSTQVINGDFVMKINARQQVILVIILFTATIITTTTTTTTTAAPLTGCLTTGTKNPGMPCVFPFKDHSK